jgi:hypothetical protein
MAPSCPSPEEAARRLARLAAWRAGALAAAVVAVALAAAGRLTPAPAALGVVVAAVIAGGAHVARALRLEEWAARDDLAALPELAAVRRHLVAADHRRDVAGALRTLASQRRTSRHDVAPLLVRRLAPVRADLLAVADEVERAAALDPRTMVELTRLMTDGVSSPLLNEAVPEGELALLLRRVRFQIATARDDLRAAA